MIWLDAPSNVGKINMATFQDTIESKMLCNPLLLLLINGHFTFFCFQRKTNRLLWFSFFVDLRPSACVCVCVSFSCFKVYSLKFLHISNLSSSSSSFLLSFLYMYEVHHQWICLRSLRFWQKIFDMPIHTRSFPLSPIHPSFKVEQFRFYTRPLIYFSFWSFHLFACVPFLWICLDCVVSLQI